jgi:1-acyl-sn-glycerol-3-phosphate acyltransferase
MMEEKHLRRFFLFRLLGAFSVVREKPKAALKSVNYAARLLKSNPNNTLWIFPQGEILPNDRRPLKFYNGLARIIEKVGKCSIASLSMRYEFMDEFKPRIFAKIGAPDNIDDSDCFDSKNLTRKMEARLTDNLDGLKSDIIDQNLTAYEKLL